MPLGMLQGKLMVIPSFPFAWYHQACSVWMMSGIVAGWQADP